MAMTINIIIGLDPTLTKVVSDLATVANANSALAAVISTKLDKILANQGVIMATLDDIATDVTEEGTTIDGLGVLFTGLQQQIADALAGVTLPPATQAKIDSIWAGTQANKAKFATALAANVPPTPTPPAA